MSTNPTNPLSPYVIEAQHIVLEAQGLRADAREAVRKLAKLLCSIEANQVFLEAGVFAALKPASAGSSQ